MAEAGTKRWTLAELEALPYDEAITTRRPPRGARLRSAFGTIAAASAWCARVRG